MSGVECSARAFLIVIPRLLSIADYSATDGSGTDDGEDGLLTHCTIIVLYGKDGMNSLFMDGGAVTYGSRPWR